jgi:ArsR family transcriptional regulator
MRTQHNQTPLELDALELPAGACCALPPSLGFTVLEAETYAAAFKAICHPVRLQIVELLSRYAGQACVCDIEGQFDLSQPTISHHLRILREAGLVNAEQRGLWVYYYTDPAKLAQLAALLGRMAQVSIAE